MADKSGEKEKKIKEIRQRDYRNYTRRDFLKISGTAAAFGAASAFGASSFLKQTSGFRNSTPTGAASGGQDYEVIKASAGERKVIRVDSGETFENVLFDQTASGSAITLVAQGTNWEVKNVGWLGEFSHKDRAFAPADTGGGTSRIKNVYMGDGVDGSVGSTRHPKFGLWVTPEHSGHLEIDNMYVEGAHDNAFYGSAPGSNGNGQRGTIHYKNSFAKDCWVSGFRISRGKVENCTAINTSSGRNGRPLWVWPTDYHGDPVEVIDCNFVAGPYPYAMNFGRGGRTTDVYMEGTHWDGDIERRGDVNINRAGGNGNNPDTSVPTGCPTSAEEAASGTSGSGRSSSGGTSPPSSDNDSDEPETPDNWNENGENHIEIEVSGGSVDDPKEYRIEGEGTAKPGEYADVNKEDSITNQGGKFVIEGVLVGHIDDYYVEGEINSVDADPELDTKVNGEPTDLKDIGSGLSLPREKTIVLQGGSQNDPANYLFEIDGEIESGDGEILDNTAIGGLEDETHEFEVDGKLTDFRAEEGITIEINSQEMNKEELIQMCE